MYLLLLDVIIIFVVNGYKKIKKIE